MRKVHYVSGVVMALFIAIHLSNHVVSIYGVQSHIEVMNVLRLFYRNIVVETILLFAVFTQIISGIKLLKVSDKNKKFGFYKLHIWSGLYLAFFLVIHISAIFVGRYYLKLDTNFYFGAAGMNTFPTNLFFIPYYLLAIISFFGHIASIHSKKMQTNIFGLTPNLQSKIIFIFGIVLAFVILFGQTNRFKGIEIPEEYNILVGK